MRKWLCVAAVLLLAGCSKTKTAEPVAGIAAGANPEPVARPAESAPPRSPVVIPNGTPLRVRVDASIDTRRNRAGDQFTATLSQPIEVEGRTVVPAGTRVLRSRHDGRRFGPLERPRRPRIEARHFPSERPGVSNPDHER